jgi:GTP-binding protein EngB required for normal cell division
MRVAARTDATSADREGLARVLGRGADRLAGQGSMQARYAEQLHALGERLAGGSLHLAVLGQFKRGKSTLLNALVGADLLPVGVVPLTTVPTFLAYGERTRATVHYGPAESPLVTEAGSVTELHELLTRTVTETGNPRNTQGVSTVSVELPVDILADGIVLIDTPGIGSTLRHNTQATLDFLAQCDAALVLTAVDPPLTETELDFLREVHRHVPRLVFALNKLDQLDPDEREEALAFTRRVLSEETGVNADGSVLGISARQGLRARQTNDGAAWRASGMAALHDVLVQELAAQKLDILARAIARHADEILANAQMDARIALAALQQPADELEERLRTLRACLRDVADGRIALQDRLQGDRKRLSKAVEDEAKELRERARTHLREIESQVRTPGVRRRAARSAVEDAWAEATPIFFGAERADLEGRMRKLLATRLSPYRERMAELIATVRRTAAELLEVPYVPAPTDDPLELTRRPYWVARPWDTDPVPGLSSLDDHLDRLVNRNVENLRWAMLQNVDASVLGFGRSLADGLERATEATEGAIEAALERRLSRGEKVVDDLHRWKGLISDLNALRSELRTLELDAVTPSPAEPRPDPSP